MKLTIAGKPVALPVDAKISIERKSPFTNEDTCSFSYPFPVPTAPNQQALGWPGRLQRVGDIADQSFILKDSGLQIMRGEVDYDDVTAQEIGVILKSGYTEFYKKMEGKKLSEVNFGSESWPITNGASFPEQAIAAKLAEWDTANTTSNGKYVLSPFNISKVYTNLPGTLLTINGQSNNTVTHLGLYYYTDLQPTLGVFYGGYFCLQFRLSFIVPKIFESAGYTVVVDDFLSSEFNKAIIIGHIIAMEIEHAQDGLVKATPVMASLEYSTLMPDIEILDFLELAKGLLCIMYEIDERKKEVRIKFKKDVFLSENLDTMKITELTGWTHSEQRELKGFALRYATQDDDLDTEYDYEVKSTVQTTLPAMIGEGDVCHITSTDRDYTVVKNDNDVLEWQQIGRLKEYRVGDGENVVELKVKIPRQILIAGSTHKECMHLPNISRNWREVITPVTFFAITLYHGRKTFDGHSFPYASFDRYSLDGTVDTAMSLKPTYLHDTIYADFLNWQTYRARAFTKYIELSLIQLLALQFGKRYNIDGIEVILDKINYELPHKGTVKIEGFTA